MKEAKACEEAARRAEAEAAEYRQKARELLDNAIAEAAMFDDDVNENEEEDELFEDNENRMLG